MIPMRLLDIQPKELKFVFESEKDITCQIQLINNTHDHVAYKVRTSSPTKYRVEPIMGIIMPKSISESLTVTMQAQRTAPPVDMVCKDTFLIQSTIVPFWTTKQDIQNPNMFSKDEDKYIEEEKFKVILITPPNNAILKEEIIPQALTLTSDEAAPKLKDQNATSSKGTMPIEFGLLRQGDPSCSRLLDIGPKEFRFVYELDKRITCQIQLVNNTHHHIAYKAKTTAPKKYAVQPNMEIIMPNSTFEFKIITTQAPPQDMVCKDKILIQSTIVTSKTTKHDIDNDPNMFSKDNGKSIEEDKFKVVLLSPQTNATLKKGLDCDEVKKVASFEFGLFQQGDNSCTRLLDGQPKELQFIFELDKHITSQVQLVNNTHHHVAYKFKTSAPKKYTVRPNMGIMLPNSTSGIITVTRQLQHTIPPDMVCKDKFLIQSTIVPSPTTKDNIINNPSIFSKDEGKCIGEDKFNVILLHYPNNGTHSQS